MSLAAIYDVPAPAKLNLFLHIVGRRADGYHLLQSPFVLIDWADTLHFELRRDGLLNRHDLGPTLPADDLCLRAARALQMASGTALGADIHVDKQVPWGAGMGGGSSDAASTLLALNRLWGLRWPRARLMEIGLALGADVPFFVNGDNAFVEGIGEKLTPMRCPPLSFAVVKPAASLATREIFEHPAMVRDSVPVIVEGYLEDADASEKVGSGAAQGEFRGTRRMREMPEAWQEGFGKNDLQGAAEDRCAEVAHAARWLESKFGNSRMTGSGSAVFSRVASKSVTDEASDEVSDQVSNDTRNDRINEVRGVVSYDTSQYGSSDSPAATWPAEEIPPGWVNRMCRSLVQHPLRAWAD